MSWDNKKDGNVDIYGDSPDIEDLRFEENACPDGRTLCRHGCVDLSSDHSNCGSCDHECLPLEVCGNGQCLIECPGGLLTCNGGCVDVSRDIYNCGRCASACPAGAHAYPVCEEGNCAVMCQPGWSDLDRDGTCESNCEIGGEEICNGKDDDCDGRCDDGFECCQGETRSCTTNCGSPGIKECLSSCSWSSCIPQSESCNGLDDDCDSVCDNGFECCRGETGTCTTICGSLGTSICSMTCRWSSCTPPQEICNGSDDDCNDAPDDITGCRIPVHRFWCDSPAYDHYYKLDSTVPAGCRYEGIGWYNYASAVTGRAFSTLPLYILYTSTGNYIDHLYTISEEEKNNALSAGAVLEGIAGYCSPSPVPGMTVPVYRLWKNSISDHFYTINEEERNIALSDPFDPYIEEGIACYAWAGP